MENISQQLVKADRLSDILQAVGFALWQLQELEDISATYFVLLTQATKGMELEAYKPLENKAKEKTFGSSIHEMTKNGLLDEKLQEKFKKLLSERNWLVHQSRMDSRNAIHDETTKKKLEEKLKSMADDALFLSKKIGELIEDYVKKYGVTEEYIDEQSKILLDEWKLAYMI